MAQNRLCGAFNGASARKLFGKKLTGAALAVALLLPGGAVLGHHNPDVEQHPSGTSYSRNLSSLQQQFNRAAADVDIVMVDRDWFQANVPLNNRNRSAVAQDEVKRKLMAELIERQTGRQFNQQILTGILHSDPLSASGLAYLTDYLPNAQGVRGLCVVFGHRAEATAQQQMMQMLGLNHAHGPLLNNAALRPEQSLPLDILNKLTDYHEIGHCMDKWYLPQSNKTSDFTSDPARFTANRHKAEMFAEIFALLVLAREGTPDMERVANVRANMRLVGGALNGPLIAQMIAPGDPMADATYMYMLQDGIWGARDAITALGPAGLQALSMDDMRQLAHELTEAHALDHADAAHAVSFMMGQQFDLSVWERIRKDFPHIARRHDLALKIKGQMNTALHEMFDLAALPADANIVRMISYDLSNLRYIGPSNAEILDRTESLTAQLRAAAGADAATRDRAVRVFLARKEALRRDLRSDDKAVRDEASLNLRLLPQALVRLVNNIDGVSAPVPGAEGHDHKDHDDHDDRQRLTPASYLGLDH